jgi:hypothetical protein
VSPAHIQDLTSIVQTITIIMGTCTVLLIIATGEKRHQRLLRAEQRLARLERMCGVGAPEPEKEETS